MAKMDCIDSVSKLIDELRLCAVDDPGTYEIYAELMLKAANLLEILANGESISEQ